MSSFHFHTLSWHLFTNPQSSVDDITDCRQNLLMNGNWMRTFRKRFINTELNIAFNIRCIYFQQDDYPAHNQHKYQFKIIFRISLDSSMARFLSEFQILDNSITLVDNQIRVISNGLPFAYKLLITIWNNINGLCIFFSKIYLFFKNI